MLSRRMPLTRFCFAFSCSDGIVMAVGDSVWLRAGGSRVRVPWGCGESALRDGLGDVLGKSVL